MQFKLPELGEGVHEGELVKWRVKTGDEVKYDQPLCEIMTDKATVEIPSAFQGKVGEVHAKEGEVVHVGQVLLTFEGKGGAAQASAPEAPKAQAPSHSTAPAPAMSAKPGNGHVSTPSLPAAPAQMSASMSASGDLSPATRPLASPSTRRVAREMGVELSQVSGSGEHGRILREDVESWLKGGSRASTGISGGNMGTGAVSARGMVMPAGGEEHIPFRGLRKKIAEKMSLSKHKAAHFTYVEEADATALVQLRAQAKDLGAAQGIKVTYLPFVMKAMVAALKKHPSLNSTVDEDKGEYVTKHYYNIGLSIQTEDGLTAPVVKNVEQKSVLQLAREIQDIVERARHKKLTREDFEGGTITLTNAGSIGGLFATPVINHPEVAILGFNKIFRKPVAKMIGGPGGKEEIVVRDWTYFSLSLDHRVIDGAIGAEFMNTFVKFIENPSLLLLEG